eukprot:scaffold2875_cov247-Pinguiococcus_pyrenoidosus.AAC.2
MRAALRRLADTGTRAKASKRLYSHVRFHPTLQLDFLPKYLDPRIQSDAPFMDLTFLGSSAQCSTAVRGVCSALLRTRQKSYLIDAGDGVCRQLQRADLSTPVDTICITHLHGDHIWGLAPVVRQVAGVARDAALQVCGPPGLYAFLVTAFRISGMTEVPDGARVEVYEMVNRGGPDAWDMQKRPLLYMDSRTGEGHVEGLVQRFLEPDEDGYWTIPCPPETQQRRGKAALGHSKTKMRAGRVKHIKDSFGYVAIEQPRRLIDSAMCKKLGLPPSQKYYKLLIGETVTTDAGRVISPEEVCREVPGRKLAYVGDSCDPRAMATLIEGADVLVHEATFLGRSNNHRGLASCSETHCFTKGTRSRCRQVEERGHRERPQHQRHGG